MEQVPDFVWVVVIVVGGVLWVLLMIAICKLSWRWGRRCGEWIRERWMA